MGSHPSKRRRSSSLQFTSIQPEVFERPQPLTAMNKCVVVALYDYPSGDAVEPTIRVGQTVTILAEEGEWWRVRSASGKEGYIPNTYAAKVFHRWLYEGISRQKAEELLLLPPNQAGSFLIRQSQTRKGAYSLSVRRTNNVFTDTVKHYKINKLDNGWYYISPRLTFPSLKDMVDFYGEMKEGICCTLTEPCCIQGSNNVPVQNVPEPVIVRKPTINWKEVDSSMLFNKDKENSDDTLLSEGLREAINSYLFMTEELGSATELS
ncbi:src-like-adapter 2 [Polypterus senegalus]|uniref:src-like-adapter 2 n=1 Tax=Polypterus senegalus TaxID=55291 RepID=UPI0019664EE3|nr:src-like-adapter 2 [Polypterus senegalus]